MSSPDNMNARDEILDRVRRGVARPDFAARRAAAEAALAAPSRGPQPRMAADTTALKVRFASKSLDGLKHTAKGINGDIHADAEYRAHLIGVMAKQAVAQATGKG